MPLLLACRIWRSHRLALSAVLRDPRQAPSPETTQVDIAVRAPCSPCRPVGDGHDLDHRSALDRNFLHPGRSKEPDPLPFFSPDGQWVGFLTASRMKKVPVEGGSVVEIMSITDGAAGATWGTDGYIYLGRFWRGGLSRVAQNGGKSETVTSPDPARKEQGHRWPEMLPDGNSILFSITKNLGASDAELGVLSIKTRTWHTILSNASNAHYLPTGHLVYAHAGTLMAVPFDLKSLSVTGPPVQV